MRREDSHLKRLSLTNEFAFPGRVFLAEPARDRMGLTAICASVSLCTTLFTATHRRPPNGRGFRYNREDDEIGVRVRGILRGVDRLVPYSQDHMISHDLAPHSRFPRSTVRWDA